MSCSANPAETGANSAVTDVTLFPVVGRLLGWNWRACLGSTRFGPSIIVRVSLNSMNVVLNSHIYTLLPYPLQQIGQTSSP